MTMSSTAAASAASPRPRPVAVISRVEKFSAAHRLHSPHLSDAENAAVFGKCNHVNFHGHNYTLRVDVRGPIDAATGMVVNIADLKRCLADTVLAECDHRNLDLDVPYFARERVPSTTENLAVYVYRTLAAALPKYVGKTGDGVTAPRLDKVTLWETDKNIVEYSEPYVADDGELLVR
ncbi:hypothetical protein H9P43_009945 [Blastocladiella emersonii ATCC 22665]|nr:hypothetical protein H9P43_009945 [Blastocladiella emersonii ATCC 22665]